jgi:hypothetical protein
VHAEGEGQGRTAESAAAAAAEPVLMVSQEALAATARMPGAVGAERRAAEAARDRAIAAAAAAAAVEPLADARDAGEGELDAAWPDVVREIDDAAAAAAAQLRDRLHAALDHFVDEVSELARTATLQALVPGHRLADDEDAVDEPADDEEAE